MSAIFNYPLSAFARSRADDSSAREGQVICLQNIGPAEQRKRLRFGIVTLAFGLLLGALLVLVGADHLLRLFLFLPFAGGATGFFQAREKT